MEIREIRKKNNITQKQAAELVGIPYRTYVRYEENNSYRGSYKYQKILDDLIEKLRIDEEHGVLTLKAIQYMLIPLFNDYNIHYCYLFGSYARGEAKGTSDVDLLVDTDITGLKFLTLIEDIRKLLGKKIDLIRLKDLSSDNPICLEILKEGIRII